jgi:beta-galactosidase/beta-glucuronidase
MNPNDCIPRPEHPRPQFQRERWLNLNGPWSFALDPGRAGMDPGREWFRSTGFATPILVPFCPESDLSGVGHKDFIEALWYHRLLHVPGAWAGQRILLHFGGVDYESELFIDGRAVGTHFGGCVSFAHDITAFVRAGDTHHLVLRVHDLLRGGEQPAGKQSGKFKSHGCHYTRTTGIWSTVWLEAVDPCGLERAQVIPDLDGGRFVIIPTFHAERRGLRFRAVLRAGGTAVAAAEAPAAQGCGLVLALGAQPRPWSPADPFLYDLDLHVLDGDGRALDEVRSDCGLRKIHVEGNRLFLNNEPLYLRLVLDQGFYPDGIWTAPADAALRRDIELALAAGFNGARLHQKVFEERFHYWADRLGYLTWGESASWGCDVNRPGAARNFLAEWREILLRDRNHPSILAWTPFNETAHIYDPRQHARTHRDAYDLCRTLDSTRPVNDASGYVHVKTDLWTVHTYEQDPARLRAQLTPTAEHGVFRNFPDREAAYAGQPYLVDEYGGIKWIPPERQAFADNSWGYGGAPRTLEEFYTRLEGLTAAILAQEHVCGYCYTQLTDVEQEQNGVYNYDRTPKFDMARIARIFGRRP